MTSWRMTRQQAGQLYRENLETLSRTASEVRYGKHPDNIVTYAMQRVINYTNLCNAYCSFCSFYRPPGHPEGYLLSEEEILKKIEGGIARGATGILIQGGDHPELKIEYY